MSQEQIAKVLAEHRDWAHSHNTVMCIDCDWDAGPVSIDHAASAFYTHQASVLAPLFAEAQAEALREAATTTRANHDHIQPGGDGYSAGFHYALYCVESSATHVEGRALVARIHERKGQG